MKYILSLLFLCGCSAETPWEVSSLPTSTRICTKNEGIGLELCYSQGKVIGYLKSSSRRFSTEKGQIQFGSITEELALDLHEGRMRAKLPDDVLQKAIQTLQDGQTVSIIIGTQTQIFQPDPFNQMYYQLTRGVKL